jgi:hypothetical protein
MVKEVTEIRPEIAREGNRQGAFHFFRVPPKAGNKTVLKNDVEESSREAELPDDGEAICCRACGRVITRSVARTEINGSHQHTFANPHGIVFQIGCFREAWGCALAGPATDEFTWFKGYHWKIAVCGGCLTHLGWRFASAGGSLFFGLVLDRLSERR